MADFWDMGKTRAVSQTRVRQAVEMDAPIELSMTGTANQLERYLHHEFEAIVDRQDIQLYVIEYRWSERLALWGAHWDPGPRPAMLDGKVWAASRPPHFRPPYDSIFVRDFNLDSVNWHATDEYPERALPRPREVRCAGWDPLHRLWVYLS